MDQHPNHPKFLWTVASARKADHLWPREEGAEWWAALRDEKVQRAVACRAVCQGRNFSVAEALQGH